MKFLNDIPDNFEELCEKWKLVDEENISSEILSKIDEQLKEFNLEFVVFENGSSYNWYIKKLTQ